MPWHTNLHSDFPIIETCYAGLLSPSELSDSVGETARLIRTTGRTLLLGDCSQLEGGHSLIDLWSVVESVAPKAPGLRFKEAIILPAHADPAELVKFWETICLNRGINARTFSDRQSALDWLLAK